MTKLDEPAVGRSSATADLWLSDDGGQSFEHFATVASSTSRSAIHPGMCVVGVASMAYSPGYLVVGTVDEAAGGSAELIPLPVT